jgi:hypothetical protein
VVRPVGARSRNVTNIAGRLRSQAHEIRKHIYYAPPWEQEGLQHQLWQIRQEARGACPGGGRDWG